MSEWVYVSFFSRMPWHFMCLIYVLVTEFKLKVTENVIEFFDGFRYQSLFIRSIPVHNCLLSYILDTWSLINLDVFLVVFELSSLSIPANCMRCNTGKSFATLSTVLLGFTSKKSMSSSASDCLQNLCWMVTKILGKSRNVLKLLTYDWTTYVLAF